MLNCNQDFVEWNVFSLYKGRPSLPLHSRWLINDLPWPMETRRFVVAVVLNNINWANRYTGGYENIPLALASWTFWWEGVEVGTARGRKMMCDIVTLFLGSKLWRSLGMLRILITSLALLAMDSSLYVHFLGPSLLQLGVRCIFFTWLETDPMFVDSFWYSNTTDPVLGAMVDCRSPWLIAVHLACWWFSSIKLGCRLILLSQIIHPASAVSLLVHTCLNENCCSPNKQKQAGNI